MDTRFRGYDKKNKTMKIWLNNKIVNDKNAKVSIFDRGFLYGDGVFETMRSYNGTIFRLDDHLGRLYGAFEVTGIKILYPKKFLRQKIYELLKINKLDNAYIRVTVTRGIGTIGLAKIECENPTVVIIVRKFTPYPDRMYKNGICVKIVKVGQNENSPISGIKTTSFLNYILARLEAKKAGFDDAIMLNSKREVSESTVSNVFLIRGRALITPSLESGILPGVTRNAVLRLAERAGLKPTEKRVAVKELRRADEVFLTSSLMEIMPVVKIDEKVIGKGKPGLFTEKIHFEYKRCARSSAG